MKQHYFLGTLLVALLGAASLPAGAQALNYFAVNAQVTNTTYTDLGTTGTAIATANTDDANSAAQPLGFTFTYGGASYSQFVLNTNGYLKLGGAAPVAPYFSNGALTTGGGPLNSADTNLLLPFNTDLEAGTGPTEYRVATTGAVGSRVTTIQWKNVSDKARASSPSNTTVVPKQYANLSFQVRLYEGSNAVEFAYGPTTASTNAATSSLVAVGLKGAGTATNQLLTLAGQAWSTRVFQDGGYSSSGGFTVRNTSLLTTGLIYRFAAAIANDVALTALYNIEQIPTGQAYAYRAQVVNKGSNEQVNFVATLNLGGANPVTVTQTIASLAPGSTTVLTWPTVAFANAGTSTVTASIPADATPTDNSRGATTIAATSSATTPAVFSYIKPGTGAGGGFGFGLGSSQSSFVGYCYAAYPVTVPFTCTFVRAQLGFSSGTVGQQVYGVVSDASGNVLGRSADYTIQAGDLNTLHTFVLAAPVTVPAGTMLAGLAQIVTATSSTFMATQPENPVRTGTFYLQSNSFAQSSLEDIASTTFFNFRLMVEVGNGGGALATASPALAQAFTVYPNPSATGRVSLAIGGANAPAGLAVTVLNPLGQVVYAGTAHDNATTPLDLGALAAGLYRVQLRYGSTFASRPLSIVR